MNEIILTTNSTLKQIFIDALIEYSDKLQKAPQTQIEGSSQKLYSIRELADYLQVSTTTAQAYKNKGCPCIQFGRKVIFDADEVLTWLSSKSKKTGRK
jgi:excisionase family DNA binding protein